MKHRRLPWALWVAAAVLIAGCAKSASPPPPATASPTPTPAIADPLNGTSVAPDSVVHRVAAVMIDNFPDARPQSGLHDADLVYEVEAEGGITRYMALFLSQPAAEVGPVRSARTYFVDLARPYDPFFAHAGENDDVIEMLKELRGIGFSDMDEITQTPEAFWRDNSRNMPHNLYTSVLRMRAVGPKYGFPDRRYDGQQFAFDPVPARVVASPPPDSAAPTPLVPEAVISFWQDYDVHFVWDGAAYQRFIDGQAQHDRDDGRAYEVSNVIAVWIPAQVLDAIGDLRMSVYSEFPAVLIRGGQATPGRWIANGPSTLPLLVDERGATLSLTPGQIYVEILPQGSSVKNGKQVWTH